MHTAKTHSAAALPRLGLWYRFWLMRGLHQQRHRLAHLDDHSLRDIGLTRAQAQQEAEKPAWNVPAHWLR